MQSGLSEQYYSQNATFCRAAANGGLTFELVFFGIFLCKKYIPRQGRMLLYIESVFLCVLITLPLTCPYYAILGVFCAPNSG